VVAESILIDALSIQMVALHLSTERTNSTLCATANRAEPFIWRFLRHRAGYRGQLHGQAVVRRTAV
jgi:hypothetical protein